MIITLNGYEINTDAHGIWLDTQIDGLDLPPIRTSQGNYSGRDGGYVGGQFYAARPIGLQGAIFSSNIATLETTRQAFQTALKGQTVTMTVLTNAGHSYILYANLLDFEMPIKRELFSAPYTLSLIAPDPTIYDNTAGGALTANINLVVSGGYTYPVTYPVTYAAGTPPTTVSNGGTIPVYPVITLTGTMTNPVLANLTTNQQFSLTPITTGPGDVVVIDVRQHTVTLNGSSIFGLIGPSSTWWSLLVGSNTISLTTSSGTDTVTGVMTWRSGYMGI